MLVPMLLASPRRAQNRLGAEASSPCPPLSHRQRLWSPGAPAGASAVVAEERSRCSAAAAPSAPFPAAGQARNKCSLEPFLVFVFVCQH